MRAALRRRQEPIAFAAAGSIVLVATLLPLGVLAGELVLAGWQRGVGSLGDPAAWALLAASLRIATAVTALALLAGVPLAVLFARTDLPARRSAFVLHAFPLFLPPFLLALGWFFLLGRQGLVGSETSARLFSGVPAVVAVLALAFTPVVTSLVALALDGVDRSLEEAARAVAAPWRVTVRILLPLVAPAVALAALVVFALALTELGVPMFLRVPVYPAAVFARLGGVAYAPGEAFALVLPLVAVALAVLACERLVARRGVPTLGLAIGRPLVPLGRWRTAGALVAGLAAALAVAPIAALAARAGREGWDAVPVWVGGSVGNSLLAAGAGATIIAAVGVVLGRAIARGRPWGAALDAVAVLGFVTPAAVLGVGLIAVWNRPATRAVYGTLAIVVLGYVARYAAIGARTIAVAIAQGSPHLEEAAQAVGGSYVRRLLGIVVPVHARGVVAAWLLALVFCVRDLETTVLFYPPGRETLPVRIFTLEANGPPAVVAALALIQVVVTASILLIGVVCLGRSRRR